MDVNNATTTSVSAIVNSTQPQPPASAAEKQPERQPEKQQDSVVVKLSEQARQQNRAENQNSDAGRTEARQQETTEPPGIQFMEGENKGGRVDTFV